MGNDYWHQTFIKSSKRPLLYNLPLYSSFPSLYIEEKEVLLTLQSTFLDYENLKYTWQKYTGKQYTPVHWYFGYTGKTVTMEGFPVAKLQRHYWFDGKWCNGKRYNGKITAAFSTQSS